MPIPTPRADENYALFDCMIDRNQDLYQRGFRLLPEMARHRRQNWLDTEGKLTHIGSYNFQGDPRARY